MTVTPSIIYPQGGDLSHLPPGRSYLDLSTCANRYGPPPRVRQALDELDLCRLRPHPHGAEETFLSAYSDYLALPMNELVPGRGITEFIRLLGGLLPSGQAAVITPDYTDTVRSFRGHLGSRDGATDTVETRLERVADGMRRFSHVVLSNPNNPLGLQIPARALAQVCRDNPSSTLVVDEAYIDFTAAGFAESMTRADVPNVAVLLSPNKLFGIAGTRTGVLWSADERLRQLITGLRLNWSISYLDAIVAAAAVESREWVRHTRSRLLATARRMETLLVERFGDSVVTGVPVHYRFVATDRASDIHDRLAEAGIAVRAFSASEPHRVSGLRITAPTDEEFEVLAKALAG